MKQLLATIGIILVLAIPAVAQMQKEPDCPEAKTVQLIVQARDRGVTLAEEQAHIAQVFAGKPPETWEWITKLVTFVYANPDNTEEQFVGLAMIKCAGDAQKNGQH